MILAAGRGERLRPLTDSTPKPLLKVGGQSLIEWHLQKLREAKFSEVVINIAYLGDKIKQILGDGSRYGLQIVYSEEPEPLETAGAIHHALSLLNDEPFLLINGDVWTDLSFANLVKKNIDHVSGHLILVNNPEHNPEGDYSLQDDRVAPKAKINYTFSGISLLHPKLVADYPRKRDVFPLREIFKHGIDQQCLSGELYQGRWWDIGTVERLTELDKSLSLQS